ncbi:hypothetical protein L228DRAFT_94058 [Xylona heveae TC161]|uniref:Uncharacterized protein n=1 Tax=Xylona heveae (strain CBS 132557 / TC161) TaxID=1328760 RepID=A0A165I2Z7_XYLHT|nr:hypothetical protein L228DRAFT_94058 [Xylona heveae TC161]KZF24301.1 hypothetical protein L228DRAFT_94058 [Xylona heveae TC161]
MSVIAPKYRSVSSEEAQKAGQQYYREKNYEAALEAFSAAIELSQFPASALDNRAATFEKLGDLRSALKDAKQMIQVEKTGVNVGKFWKTIKLIHANPSIRRAIFVREKSCREWRKLKQPWASTNTG